ncbi:MAG: hypothetical protein LBD24_09030 [Spirochaetaceae bacterium]|nr:hypothetical protein [Spirochaetaceae bacterium]
MEGTQDYEVLGDFSRKVWAHKFLGQSGGQTLFNISSGMTEGAVRRAIEREVRNRGGTAAINIKIKWGSNPVQWIVNYLTATIWAPGTITVSGTVVKDKAAAQPVEPAEKEAPTEPAADPPAAGGT